uniref:Uncharacterized protein n=1 Tax=Arundo donax TaxID=35708 RepID=A0A0A8XWF5_ARUDO
MDHVRPYLTPGQSKRATITKIHHASATPAVWFHHPLLQPHCGLVTSGDSPSRRLYQCGNVTRSGAVCL